MPLIGRIIKAAVAKSPARNPATAKEAPSETAYPAISGRVRYNPNCNIASMQNSWANRGFHSLALSIFKPSLTQRPRFRAVGNRGLAP